VSYRDDAAFWACTHGQDARHGCVTCFEESASPDVELPMWDVAVWFTSDQPIPVKALQDVHRHGRRFLLDKLSAPHIYLLTGHARAERGAQAVAGVVGFLVHNRHVVDAFTVKDTRAVRLAPSPDVPSGERVWP
jgi:hypothetical protein